MHRKPTDPINKLTPQQQQAQERKDLQKLERDTRTLLREQQKQLLDASKIPQTTTNPLQTQSGSSQPLYTTATQSQNTSPETIFTQPRSASVSPASQFDTSLSPSPSFTTSSILFSRSPSLDRPTRIESRNQEETTGG